MQKNIKNSILVCLAFLLVFISPSYSKAASSAYTLGNVNVRDRYTNAVIGSKSMGTYVYGDTDNTFLYLYHNGVAAKIYKSVLTFESPTTIYVDEDVNVRDQDFKVVGRKFEGQTINAVRIEDYYRFYDNGVKFIHHSYGTTNQVRAGVYTLRTTEIIGARDYKVKGYKIKGDYFKGVEEGDYIYFTYNNESVKVRLADVFRANPKTRYVTDSANVRDADMNIVGKKALGDEIYSVPIGDHFRFYEDGAKFVHKSLVSDTKPEVKIPETDQNQPSEPETPTIPEEPKEPSPTPSDGNISFNIGDKIQTKLRINGYVTAYDAMDGTNKVSDLEAGTYYVYKLFNGIPNISRVQGSAGSWVNYNDLIKAINSDGTGQLPSEEETPVYSSISNLQALGFMASAVKTDIVLSWEPMNGASNYDIYESVNGTTNFRHIATTSGNKIVLSGKTKGVTYNYYVVGFTMVSGGKSTSKASPIRSTTISETSYSTIKNFLTNGLGPMGSTVYIYGGGWDDYSSTYIPYSTRIGVSPKWREFFSKQDSSYNFTNYYYKRDLGLDCSGFLSFMTYNAMNTKENQSSLVTKSTNTGPYYQSKGFGYYDTARSYSTYRAGDVMFTEGHVYIVVGQCDDGSVVIMHSSPKGPKLGSTPNRYGSYSSQANKLATEYMSKYFPQYYAIDKSLNTRADYLTNYMKFTWYSNIFNDPDGYRSMSASDILADLFKDR